MTPRPADVVKAEFEKALARALDQMLLPVGVTLADRLSAVVALYDEAVATASHVHDETMPDWCGRCLEAHNAGAVIVAQRLAQIALTEDHPGTFGSKEIENAAQTILKGLKAARKEGLRQAVKIIRIASEFGASARTIVGILQDKINEKQPILTVGAHVCPSAEVVE